MVIGRVDAKKNRWFTFETILSADILKLLQLFMMYSIELFIILSVGEKQFSKAEVWMQLRIILSRSPLLLIEIHYF